MTICLTCRFSLNYGWHHCWHEPTRDTLFLKEYVKGPFNKTLLAFPESYLALDQKSWKENPVAFKNGIPDPWAEHIIYNYLVPNNNQRNAMPKEDVNIANTLRKRYRLYLGQGIPDPCLIYPYIEKQDIVGDRELKTGKTNNNNSSFHHQLQHKNSKEKSCFCCEKKYLFKCPDECEGNKCENLKDPKKLNCQCENCHQKAKENSPRLREDLPIPEEKPILRSSKPFKKIDKETETAQEEEFCLCHVEYSKISPTTEDVNATRENLTQTNASLTCCTCPRGNEDLRSGKKSVEKFDFQIQARFDQADGVKKEESGKKIKRRRKEFKICCLPYFKESRGNFHGESSEKIVQTHSFHPENSTGVSDYYKKIISWSTKEIQTELETLKSSKSIQTDDLAERRQRGREEKSKPKRNCLCSSNCLLCDMVQRRGSKLATCPFTTNGQSKSNQCSFGVEPEENREAAKREANHGETEEKSPTSSSNQWGKTDAIKKARQTNLTKERETLKFNQKMYCCTFSPPLCDAITNPAIFRGGSHRRSKSEFPNSGQDGKFVYHCRPSRAIPPEFGHRKEARRRRPLDELNFKKINMSGPEVLISELGSTCGKLGSNFELSPIVKKKGEIDFEKCRRLENCRTFSRFDPPFKSVATMTSETAILKRIPLEIKYLKEILSDESKTYGLVNRCKENFRGRKSKKRSMAIKKKKIKFQ